ncbi:hypothetical protein Tco_1342234 [Tanacetum coccineum]
MKPSKIPNPTKSTMPLLQELNLLKQKQVLRRSKLDLTRQKLLQLLKAKDSRLPPLSPATTLPLPTIPLITHLQQTPAPTPTTVPSSSLQDLPNFAVSSIPDIVDAYLANKMHEADQVKEQVKAQVSKILPKIEKTVNEQLEVEVLTHSSNESKISHAVATNLSELELKKILIDKMESNNTPKEKTSKTTGKSTEGSKSHHKSAQAEEPMHTVKDLEEPVHQEFVTGDTEDKSDDETSQHPDWLKVDTMTPELLVDLTFKLMKGSCKSLVELEYFFKEVYKATTDQLDWNNPKGQQYPHDLRKPLPLIPNSRGHQVIPFDHFINNDLAYLSGGVSSRTYTTSVTKTKATDYGHIKWIEDLVPNRMESACDVYSKRRIIAVTKLQIVEWHNYKHLDWITVHKDDDKLYTLKEGDFNRLRIQDIEDMLLLLVQGKLTNLTVEERLAFNGSL